MTTQDEEKNLNKCPLVMRVIGMGRPYFVKTPWWLKRIYPNRVWDIKTKEKTIYLTFDDGPHPVATPFVLDELRKHNAKATFFCIGKNVVAHPEIYKRIIDEGHRTGNHTYNHFNGWKTDDGAYLDDIAEAAKYINSNLFRPPYGRINSSQAKHLREAIKNGSPKIIMWDILSGDFDESLDRTKCLKQVISKTVSGSIIVFHDSEKAFNKIEYTLPAVLDFFSKSGYNFKRIEI